MFFQKWRRFRFALSAFFFLGSACLFLMGNERVNAQEIAENEISLESILDAEVEKQNTREAEEESALKSSFDSADTPEKTASQQLDGVQLAHSHPFMRTAAEEKPLEAPIRWAKEVARQMESNVRDYSCTLTRRERVNGVLGKTEVMEAKIRQEPLSVYLRFVGPRRIAGREVIYVENANDGKLQVHGVGFEALVGTLNLEPTGRIAMKGCLHPITEIGILNMVRQMIDIEKNPVLMENFQVSYSDVKLNGRDCVCIEVVNPERNLEPNFQRGRIYVDMELNLPVKYVSWGWGNGNECPLIEEYTYSNICINPGFTDRDFDIRNPNYRYRESRK